MSNKLEKLLVQCHTEYHDGHRQHMEQIDYEKFAELIVQQCISAIYSSDIKEKKQEQLVNDIIHRVFGDSWFRS